jgi:hypothetical protein
MPRAKRRDLVHQVLDPWATRGLLTRSVRLSHEAKGAGISSRLPWERIISSIPQANRMAVVEVRISDIVSQWSAALAQ